MEDASGSSWKQLVTNTWNWTITYHPGKTLGTIFGFLFALLVMLIGIWWAIFISITTVIGFLVGAQVDSGGREIRDFLDRVLPPR